ncbi:MAG: cob(I)yrinic acid a,c-diamide adenosyltransferase [Firmicutes bacterium]|nr:cob(I)yrinic acid a,c-diamide adenosyltransferase [Bacillota bacterium]
MEQGIVQVYTGDGKGKTTAAIGQVTRAWGRGLKVKVFQFLKAPGGSGEQWAFLGFIPPLHIYPLGTGDFIQNRPPTLKEITLAANGWKQIEEAIWSDTLDIVVIDELSQVINKGLLPLEKVLTILKQKPVRLELILTGRDMPQEIIELADLVTEMKMVKHPFQKGITAREGIEF